MTKRTKYEHFLDFLRSELRAKNLLHIIDSTVINTNIDVNSVDLEKLRFRVRDIILNRIDQHCHARVLEITDPVDLLHKNKEINKCEMNVTSPILRRQ